MRIEFLKECYFFPALTGAGESIGEYVSGFAPAPRIIGWH